ncbi:LysR family transcriptional regulator [Lentzea flaviverrucosa]|uniref:DNA-binding transcriptional regulator, LysR family n=1 Tax=Lentzea flaviverrucosa TaxID=200379 RepID=A0A1H9RUF0_9PSEU|nr:LysR substrate-binding domain-containing protein [Lentzea flaviverrucosa]RDI33146.1 DNA-binding transcriptional LysR family regulator [Lentzea flaviverrucosa]SER76277.1 DNA-binding transcriptional regulator, LysR family [Lentzea flaviverrucosa]
MELRQLEYFVAVAESGSFTRAAERVHVAQPGVSAQIRRLERELGHALLDRSGRTVTLTDVGAAVLPLVRAALGSVESARRTVEEMAGLVRGAVRAGMVVSCGIMDLPELLSEFHSSYPAVEITLSEGNSDELISSLVDGRLDFALVGYAGAEPEGLSVRVLADEPLVAAVAASDPWYGRESVPLDELQERGLISLPPGTGLRGALDAACGARRPRIAFEASAPPMVITLAQRGLGPAILAASMVSGLHAVRITDPSPHSRLAFAWRTEGPHSPAARALIGLAENHVTTI